MPQHYNPPAGYSPVNQEPPPGFSPVDQPAKRGFIDSISESISRLNTELKFGTFRAESFEHILEPLRGEEVTGTTSEQISTILSNIAKEAATLPVVPAHIVAGLAENPLETSAALARFFPEMASNLITAAQLNPIVQTGVALGRKESIAELARARQAVAQAPLFHVLGSLGLRGVLKKGTLKASKIEETLTRLKKEIPKETAKIAPVSPEVTRPVPAPVVEAKPPAAVEPAPKVKESIETVEATMNLFEGAEPLKAKEFQKRLEKKLTVEGARMQIEESAKLRLEEISAKNPQQTVGWDATDAMSLDIKFSEVQKFAAEFGQGKATAILTRGIKDLTNAAAETDALLKKMDVANLSRENIIAFQENLSKSLVTVYEPIRVISGEAGRILQKHQKYTKPRMELMKKLAEIPPEEIDIWKSVIEKFNRIDPANPRQYAALLQSLEKPNFMNYVHEFWYNSILSGPPTHLVNSISNTVWQAFQTPFRGVRAVVDIPVSKFQGRQREFYLSEIAPMWVGYKQGIKKGMAKSLDMILKGQVAGDMTKWGLEVGPSLEAFARSPSKAVRAVAPIISLPTRALRAEDIFFRSIAYDAEINATAMRKAIKEGLKGPERNNRQAELVRSPTEDMMVAAGKFADYTTYVDAPGKVTAGIMYLRTKVPGGRFVIPFVRTPANLLKRGAELTPGLGVFVQRKMLSGPDVSTVITNQILGTMIASYFAVKYIDGEITGKAPAKKSDREAFYRQGKLPWAMKFGDHWIQYRRMEPFNMPIATVAAMGDAWRDNGDEPIDEKVLSVGISIARNFLDSSYLSQLSYLLTVLESGETSPKAMRKFLNRYPAAFVPFSSFLRSTARAYEAGEKGEAILREPEGVSEIILSQLPGLTGKVSARKNVWGENIVLPGGPIRQFLPYKAATETTDLVERELERLDISPGMPAKKIRNLELTDQQYDEYLTTSGELIYTLIDRAVRTPAWSRTSDENKIKFIERIIRTTRESTRRAMIFKWYNQSE